MASFSLNEPFRPRDTSMASLADDDLDDLMNALVEDAENAPEPLYTQDTLVVESVMDDLVKQESILDNQMDDEEPLQELESEPPRPTTPMQEPEASDPQPEPSHASSLPEPALASRTPSPPPSRSPPARTMSSLLPQLPSEAEEPSLVEVGADEDPLGGDASPLPLLFNNEPSMVQVGAPFYEDEDEPELASPVELPEDDGRSVSAAMAAEASDPAPARALEDPARTSTPPAAAAALERMVSAETVSVVAAAAAMATASAMSAAHRAEEEDRRSFMSSMLHAAEKKRERAAVTIQAAARGYLIRQQARDRERDRERERAKHPPRSVDLAGTTSRDIDTVLGAILNEVADGRVSFSLELTPSLGRISIQGARAVPSVPAPPDKVEIQTQTREPVGPPTTAPPPYMPEMTPLPALAPPHALTADADDDSIVLSQTVPTATSSLISRAMETIRNIDARLQAEEAAGEAEDAAPMNAGEVAKLREAAEAAARLLANLDELQLKASKSPAKKTPVKGKAPARPPRMEQEAAIMVELPAPPKPQPQLAPIPPPPVRPVKGNAPASGRTRALREMQSKLTNSPALIPPLSDSVSPAAKKDAHGASILERSAMAPRPGPAKAPLGPVHPPAAAQALPPGALYAESSALSGIGSELAAETSWLAAGGEGPRPLDERARLAIRHQSVIEEKRERARKKMEAEQNRAKELQAWLEQQEAHRKAILEEREQDRKRRLQERMAKFSQLHQDRVEARYRYKREQEEKKAMVREAREKGHYLYSYQRMEDEWRAKEGMERAAEIQRAMDDRRREDIANARHAPKNDVDETLTRAALVDLNARSVERKPNAPHVPSESAQIYAPSYRDHDGEGLEEEEEETAEGSANLPSPHRFGVASVQASSSYEPLESYSPSVLVQLTPQPQRAAILDYVDEPVQKTHPQPQARKPRAYSAVDPPKRKAGGGAKAGPVDHPVLFGGWVGGRGGGQGAPGPNAGEVRYSYGQDRQLAAVRQGIAQQADARRAAVLQSYGDVVQGALRPLRNENEAKAAEMLERKRAQVQQVGLRAQREPRAERERVNLREIAGLGVGGAGFGRR